MTEKKHIQWLLNELPGLRQQLVISEETEKAVRTHYEKRIAASRNYFPLALAILGLTLIAGGITLIFNYNWDMLSQEWQTAVSFLPLALGACVAFCTLAGNKSFLHFHGCVIYYICETTGVSAGCMIVHGLNKMENRIWPMDSAPISQSCRACSARTPDGKPSQFIHGSSMSAKCSIRSGRSG